MTTIRPGLFAALADPSQPSVARVHDALLGGASNFKPDRDLAATLLDIEPRIGLYARETVAFRDRAVRVLAQRGIRQYLDLGCGLPTIGAVHHVAHAVAPDARVVYLDADPVVVAYLHRSTAGDIRLTAIGGDVRDPVRALTDAADAGLITPTQPMAILMTAVLQFISDADDPAGIVAAVRDIVALGSCLVLSHPTRPPVPDATNRALRQAYAHTTTELTLRTRRQVNSWLHGWTLLEPGVATVATWRREPLDEPAPDIPALAAVAVKDLPPTKRVRAARRKPPPRWRNPCPDPLWTIEGSWNVDIGQGRLRCHRT